MVYVHLVAYQNPMVKIISKYQVSYIKIDPIFFHEVSSLKYPDGRLILSKEKFSIENIKNEIGAANVIHLSYKMNAN